MYYRTIQNAIRKFNINFRSEWRNNNQKLKLKTNTKTKGDLYYDK